VRFRRALPPPTPTPIFSGYFSDWSSVCEACKDFERGSNTIVAFDSNRWMKRQHDMLALARQGIYPRPTNLPLLAAITSPKFIVDLGGGGAWTSELVTNSRLGKFKSYLVLEIPSVCKEFSQVFASDSGVSFYSSISEAPPWMISRTDILYSNSTLQYFPDDSILLALVSSLSPSYILLDDFQSSIADTFFTLQNYYGLNIPYRFSNLGELLVRYSELGYELLVSSDYASPITANRTAQIQGAKDKNLGIGRSLSLLFEKVV
jgi:putative methyltransferase (TIGR04325 family)